jgi:glycosyltransferase involved in cell wall biosynthesis
VPAGETNLSVSVTAVIPAYNSAAYIGNALRSVLGQTSPPREIIVVDDGSADGTAEVAACYPICVIRQKNGGPGAARNAGIRAASGEWIALLDADDCWNPDKLERQIPALNDPRLGVLSSTARYPPGPMSFEELWARNRVATSTVLLRKAAIEDAGYFDEDRALISVEDYNLWLRISAKGWVICNTGTDLISYTPAPGNLSGQNEKMVAAELANIAKISSLLTIPEPRVRARRAAVCLEYGINALHGRQKLSARGLFRQSLQNQASVASLLYFCSSFLPNFLLDAKRRLLSPD